MPSTSTILIQLIFSYIAIQRPPSFKVFCSSSCFAKKKIDSHFHCLNSSSFFQQLVQLSLMISACGEAYSFQTTTLTNVLSRYIPPTINFLGWIVASEISSKLLKHLSSQFSSCFVLELA